MIFQFHAGDVTFFEEDKAYFEKRLIKLEKLLGFDAGDSDSVEIRLAFTKSKHHSGDRFAVVATLVCPRGNFRAESTCSSIKQCADELQEKFKSQLEKFHGKRK